MRLSPSRSGFGMMSGGFGLGFAVDTLIFILILYEIIRFTAFVFMTSFSGCEFHAALAGSRTPFSVFGTMVLVVVLATVWSIPQVVIGMKSGGGRLKSIAASLTLVCCLGALVYIHYFHAAAHVAHRLEINRIEEYLRDPDLPKQERTALLRDRLDAEELWDRAEGYIFWK